jgi:hypothetical protein
VKQLKNNVMLNLIAENKFCKKLTGLPDCRSGKIVKRSVPALKCKNTAGRNPKVPSLPTK